IVLNMWASWCTSCYAEARALAHFEQTHPQAQVVGVDIQDTRAAASALYRRFGSHHPSTFDPDGLIATRFHVPGVPPPLLRDGAEVRVEGRGYAKREHAGDQLWRVAATLRFEADDARYAWLSGRLGVWAGEFDAQAHRAYYHAFLTPDPTVPRAAA